MTSFDLGRDLEEIWATRVSPWAATKGPWRWWACDQTTTVLPSRPFILLPSYSSYIHCQCVKRPWWVQVGVPFLALHVPLCFPLRLHGFGSFHVALVLVGVFYEVQTSSVFPWEEGLSSSSSTSSINRRTASFGNSTTSSISNCRAFSYSHGRGVKCVCACHIYKFSVLLSFGSLILVARVSFSSTCFSFFLYSVVAVFFSCICSRDTSLILVTNVLSQHIF